MSVRAVACALLAAAAGTAAALGAAGCGEKRGVGSTGTPMPAKPPAATAPAKTY